MNSLIVLLGVCLPSGISKCNPIKRFVANFATHKFHQVKKDACVNSCFAVLSSLVVRIKVWDNIYLIALAWVPV